MYRLIRFKAVNCIGFVSGMSRKNFEIDLTEIADKPVICVIGDNGSGKSTFLSLVHPWHVPTNGKSKFIVPGKEGMVVREYESDDGSTMISKCLYHPKKDRDGKHDGHTASCFLELTRPGCDPVELNPSGNVSSYKSLLYTYFGITKDYLTFASYTTEVASIVKMTDSERKSSVGTLVPNTKRYEIAYDMVNEKYRDLRNLTRNIAQKILALRDEDSLEADYKRLTKELKEYTEEREDRIRKLAKMEGRLKELTHGGDVDDLVYRYNMMIASLATFDSEIDRVYKKLMKLYAQLGIEPEKEGSIAFRDIDKVSSYVMKYERKLAANESSMRGYQDRESRLREELHRTEKDITETESVLYGIQMQDIKELEKTRAEYKKRLASLRYTKMQDKFEGMSYDEVVSFSRSVVAMDTMIQALYDDYGDLVSQFFSESDWHTSRERAKADIESLQATISTSTARRDQLYRQIIEKQEYLKFQSIIDQRPSNCKIDTCPFIANALKYQGVADEIAALVEQYKQSGIVLTEQQNQVGAIEATLAMGDSAQALVRYLFDNSGLLAKYLGITDLKTLYSAIANGTWKDLLDVMKLKDMAAILSEKQLYLQIVNMDLPELEHQIELAKVYGSNRDLLTSQLDRLNRTRKLLKDELAEYKMHICIGEQQREIYEEQLELWKAVSDQIDKYRDLITSQLETKEEADKQDETIRVIKDLNDKCKEQKHYIRELDDLIRDRHPKREKVKLDLDAVRRLQIERLEVERDFIVTDVIRSIVAPGKGVRKELIEIYMDDICTIANQLLLNTFGGKLYLQKFEITDKVFVIPYVYNGSEGTDIVYASGGQQSTIASAISLAILSKLVDRYGIYTGDEQDGTLNPKNKGEFIRILTTQMRYIGIVQAFIVTQEPKYYENSDCGILVFPGGETDIDDDIIYV